MVEKTRHVFDIVEQEDGRGRGFKFFLTLKVRHADVLVFLTLMNRLIIDTSKTYSIALRNEILQLRL